MPGKKFRYQWCPIGENSTVFQSLRSGEHSRRLAIMAQKKFRSTVEVNALFDELLVGACGCDYSFALPTLVRGLTFSHVIFLYRIQNSACTPGN